METRSCRGRQLDDDLVVGQVHAVVPGLCKLLRVREPGPEGIFRDLRGEGRHQGDIPQVGASCPAEMCVAEPDDHAIRIIVSGAPVPPFTAVVGTELHHSKWNGCPGVGVTVSTRADERIDTTHEIPSGCSEAGNKNKEQGEDSGHEEVFHGNPPMPGIEECTNEGGPARRSLTGASAAMRGVLCGASR